MPVILSSVLGLAPRICSRDHTVGLLLVAAFVALVMMRLLFRRPIIATRAAI